MKKIIIGFSRPKGFFEPFSWLIRIAYWSSYSHAYVRFDLKDVKESVVLQASGLKVNLILAENFDAVEDIYKEFELPISPKNLAALKKFGIGQLGKPYSIKGIFGMAVVRIGQILGIKLNNPFQYDKESDFCSELTSYIVENFDNVQLDEPVANMAPQDLEAVMVKLGCKTVS
jgi:hypothetical protein